MLASKLTHYITVQQRQIVKDALGQSIETWVDFASMWANVKFQSGSEFNRANRESSEVVASVRVRYREDITTEMRVMFKGKVYNLYSQPLPDNFKEYVDFPVTSREI